MQNLHHLCQGGVIYWRPGFQFRVKPQAHFKKSQTTVQPPSAISQSKVKEKSFKDRSPPEENHIWNKKTFKH